MTDRRFPVTIEGQRRQVVVMPSGIDVDGRTIDWLEVDLVDEGKHSLTLLLADGSSLALSLTGTTGDDLSRDLRRARRRARFSSLAATTDEPIETFVSREQDGHIDVHVFSKVVVLEPRLGHPIIVPLPLIDHVIRDGHAFVLRCRGLDDVRVAMLGNRTDDFMRCLDSSRRALRAATADAFSSLDPGLTALGAPDGWAVGAVDAGSAWAALRRCAETSPRAGEFARLAALAEGVGAAGDSLRLGVFTDGGTQPMLFVLVRMGRHLVLEALDVDDRATFVFDDIAAEELNALLLLCAFRRELISLPDDQLGRWGVAVRTLPAVRRLRSALAHRVVHGPSWTATIDRLVAEGQ